MIDNAELIRDLSDLRGELFGRPQFGNGGGRFGRLERQLNATERELYRKLQEVETRVRHVEDAIVTMQQRGVKRDLSLAVEAIRVVVSVGVIVVASLLTVHFVGVPHP